MRTWPAALLSLALLAPLASADKLTLDDRIELTRGLTAEYATVKQFLPRSKKPLPYHPGVAFDKSPWDDAAKQYGPAARVGDLVQITKISIEDNKIELQINGGFKGGRKWYQGVQVGMGGATNPIGSGDSNAQGGTVMMVEFDKPLEHGIDSTQIKKMLSPVLDFEKHSATQLYAETLAPETKKAIRDKRVLEGMDRDQVLMALGRPDHKSREVKDGMELEDWVFGHPPGKIVFVTFNGSKVIKVKEAFAGLGAEVSDQKPPKY